MEWLTMIEPWHWLVLGLLLVITELMIPMFFILWLGVAAMVVAGVLAVSPIGFSAQLFIWAILSVIFVLLWHKFLSPKMKDRTLAGLSKESLISQVGLVLSYNEVASRGELKFPAPILGEDEWSFLCQEKLTPGDKVKVTDISGNTLVVVAYK